MNEWEQWEDWASGLYAAEFDDAHVWEAAQMLTDPDVFLETAREMVRAWPVAANQNLRHMWTGRNAWVGQASAAYGFGAPGAATRQAWGQLSNMQQRTANGVAVAVRMEWEGVASAETLFEL